MIFSYIKTCFVSLCIFLCTGGFVYASEITLVPSKQAIGIGEQMYIDVMLDPEGIRVNGIEGSLSYSPEYFSLVRIEDGQSVIPMWITKPQSKEGTISFVGMIPNGFAGIIDPFKTGVQSPGLVFRVVLESKKSGTGAISLSQSIVTRNDGVGTEEKITGFSRAIHISSSVNKTEYQRPEDTTPELYAYITSDPALYDDAFVLIFDARDSGSGIKEVRVKEGSRDWKTVESPYLLEDQSRRSTIFVEAINQNDIHTRVTLDALPLPLFSVYTISILILCFLICVFVWKKYYAHTKKIS